jgi:outer membrane biosynthesis protein TonB
MFFNFDDREQETTGIERAISWREGILLSFVVHVCGLLAIIFLPAVVPQLFAVAAPDTGVMERRMAEARQREANERRFVFVQPRQEFEAKRPPENPELSDRDRTIMTPFQRPPNPTSTLPYSRGNTPERIDQPGTPAPSSQPATPAESAGNAREQGSPAPGPQSPEPPQPDDPIIRALRGPRPRAQSGNEGTGTGGGRLGEAMRDASRYVPSQIFENAQGGGEFGSAIQFDTKGVEFGPWVRRFIAQIKRNWFIPYAAMSLRGHVAVAFNVHRDGSISDLAIVGPSAVDAVNNSSFNAIAASNPTQELPPEYPSDRAYFTVTFFYNETPPSR